MKLNKLFILCAVAVLVLGAGSLRADIIPVANPSFELDSPNWTSSVIGWDGQAYAVMANSWGGQFQRNQDGQNFLFASGYGIPMSQTLTNAVSGTEYKLTVAVSCAWFTDQATDERIQLQAGGVTFAEYYEPNQANVNFQDVVLQGTAPNDGALKIVLVSGSDRRAAFDNVRLESVPEPMTLALLAVGGLVSLKRRNRA